MTRTKYIEIILQDINLCCSNYKLHDMFSAKLDKNIIPYRVNVIIYGLRQLPRTVDNANN